MSTKKSVILRTTVPRDTYEALAREVEKMGGEATIASVMRDMIEALVAEREQLATVTAPPPAPVETSQFTGPKPTAAEWVALNKWLNATGRAPDKALLITTRSGLMAWAVTQGFQKPTIH